MARGEGMEASNPFLHPALCTCPAPVPAFSPSTVTWQSSARFLHSGSCSGQLTESEGGRGVGTLINPSDRALSRYLKRGRGEAAYRTECLTCGADAVSGQTVSTLH